MKNLYLNQVYKWDDKHGIILYYVPISLDFFGKESDFLTEKRYCCLIVLDRVWKPGSIIYLKEHGNIVQNSELFCIN